MREFFRCVAEAVVEHGVKGFAEMVPGGNYIYAVSESAVKKYREKRRGQQQHDDFMKLANAKLDEARVEAVLVVKEAFAMVPVGADSLPPTPEEIIDLELYLTAIPEAVRQSLKRADDPTGTTVPAGFAMESAEDVVKVLPPRPPRFRPGMGVPNKAGWVLDRLLGMGGFGEVWFAKHERMTSLSGAIKFCFGQTGRDLIHEADLIDRVMEAGTHPNIVPLKDAHLEGDTPWLLFEYVAGGNLTDWIHTLAGMPNEQRLPQVMSAIRELADAVAYFHTLSKPIVHRDLKPSNILLDPVSKKLRITDFGIGSVMAKETNRQESRGQSSRGGRLLSYLRGSHTPIYSSPQQRIGKDADPRDDVHALGVIAYQMLTGKLDGGPGPRAGQTLKKLGVPEATIELILNCASEEVEDRPATAAVLAKLLADGDDVAMPKVAAVPVVAVTAVPVQKIIKAGDRLDLVLPGGGIMPFAWCPPGTFQMGSPESEKQRGDEEALHTVTLTKGFYAGIGPVTRGQFARFVALTKYETEAETQGGESVTWRKPGFEQTDDHPVCVVTWNDAQAFCKWLATESKRPIRLPMEAEWEYAARAGTSTPYYFGSELNGTQANCNGNGPYGTSTKGPYLQKTTPVGSYSAKFPHPWGLADVHGNVFQWCEYWYGAEFYNRGDSTDPMGPGPDDGSNRVFRGGSWDASARYCRSAYRCCGGPATLSSSLGFRCVVGPSLAE